MQMVAAAELKFSERSDGWRDTHSWQRGRCREWEGWWRAGKDGWWMVLIQEAAAPLYLGSTSQTCRGDGWAVSPLFMDHRPSPISYMPQKPRSLKNSYYLTVLCLSISDSLPFSFSSLTNGAPSSPTLFQMYSSRGRTLWKNKYYMNCNNFNSW